MHSSITVLSYKPSLPPDGLLADITTRAMSEVVTCGLRTIRSAGDTPARPNRRFWMWRDIRILQNHYPSATPVAELAEALGRSIGSIRSKARQLGLRRPLRHPRQVPEAALDIQRQRLGQDLVEVDHKLSDVNPTLRPRLNRTAGGRVIWADDIVLFVGELWKRRYSSAAIGKILGLKAGAIGTLANRVELPRRKLQDGRPIELLEEMPVGDPLAAPVCKSIERMMEPIRCIDLGKLFFRRSGDFGRRRCKAAQKIMSRTALGTMH